MKAFLVTFFFALCSLAAMADEGPWFKFQENRGQWAPSLQFVSRTAAMDVMVGHGKFMLQLKNRDDFDALHAAHHGEISLPDNFQVRFHNLEFELLNAQPSAAVGLGGMAEYVNYFIGDDPARWAGGVRQYGAVTMPNVYKGIDFKLLGLGDHLKYEFELAPGANAAAIRFVLRGADSLALRDGQLHFTTSCGPLVDDEPLAWQYINGVQQFVPCAYRLAGDTLSFSLGPYRADLPLTLDPTLIFSTFSGSNPTDNWGSTATYDSLGNLYAGGIAITTLAGTMNGYPTTTGAFQTSFAGGSGSGLGTDIVITKFNGSGSSLSYSTYLGGSNNEIPHSLVVNNSNQLYVLATTSSNNFPVTSGAFDVSFNGGSAIGTGATGNNNSNSVPYPNGADIVITKFNTGGTALVGSTYLGGTGNDGINMSDTLQKAYADEFRGEIVVDDDDYCHVATSTQSTDFPTSSGYQMSFAGGITDGVVVRMNPSLTAMVWGTYLGGSEPDGAYSLQFDPQGDVLVCGGTKSSDFPTTASALNPNYMGGTADGWVVKLSANGQSLMAGTYLGTSSYDQSFFVQADAAGAVYCVGQTLGNYPIGPSWVYSNASSGQFLHKLSNNLQNTIFSTRWGSGNSNINLSLSAFLVNECNHIFVAGWGGGLFGTGTSTSTGGTTTNGLVTTTNAHQTTTDGSDLYFIVFEDSAKAVLFASYFGGTGASGGEHVDGGTSRFDKKGIIYQAVCAGCGGGNAFPTTSGAYATTNGSNNCNLGAIKYDLVTLTAEADVDGPTQACINDSIQFANQSFGGSIYLWDFGDGNTSDEFEPKHAYSLGGTYTVTLIIQDSVSCVFADTDLIEVQITPGPVAQVNAPGKVCPGEQVVLSASGGTSYQWLPINFLSTTSAANTISTPEHDITYTVSVTDSCGTDTASVRVKLFPDKTNALLDTAVCQGLGTTLWASGGLSYSWAPGAFLVNSNVQNPYCLPDSTIHYTVTIVDSFLCVRTKPTTVFVEGFVPQVWAAGDTTVCSGERVLLYASGAENYEWTPSTWLLNPLLNNTIAYPDSSVVYTVRTHNSCGEARDSVVVLVNPINVEAFSDTAVCVGDTVFLGATGADAYKWTGPEFEVARGVQFPSFVPDSGGWYVVQGSNISGCVRFDSLFVRVNPRPALRMLTNTDTVSGLENMLIVAQSEAPIHWSSTGFVPCTRCDSLLVYPLVRTTYFAKAVDSNGCTTMDSISLQAVSALHAPLAFSPDGNGINDFFLLSGHNILAYKLHIFDRWGHLVFATADLHTGWNGQKFNTGEPLAMGVYGYEVEYTVLPDQPLHQHGQVLLVR